jgi:type III secretory pathway component EscV
VRSELERARTLGEERGMNGHQLPYLLALADHHVEARDWSEASRCAEAALELAPHDQRVTQLLERIRYARAWVRDVEAPDPWVTPVLVEVSQDVLPWVEPPAGQYLYDKMLPNMREQLRARWGFSFPGVRIRPNDELPLGTVVVSIDEVPRYAVTVPPLYLAGASQTRLMDLGVVGDATVCPWDGTAAAWITEDDLHALPTGSIPVWDPPGVIVSTVAVILERHRGELVSVQDATLVAREMQREFKMPEEQMLELAARVRRVVEEGHPVTDHEALRGELAHSNGTETPVGAGR